MKWGVQGRGHCNSDAFCKRKWGSAGRALMSFEEVPGTGSMLFFVKAPASMCRMSWWFGNRELVMGRCCKLCQFAMLRRSRRRIIVLRYLSTTWLEHAGALCIQVLSSALFIFFLTIPLGNVPNVSYMFLFEPLARMNNRKRKITGWPRSSL